ncbi:MAG: hypothetical protein ABI977_26420 [Acidobacteriota bacterium]
MLIIYLPMSLAQGVMIGALAVAGMLLAFYLTKPKQEEEVKVS